MKKINLTALFILVFVFFALSFCKSPTKDAPPSNPGYIITFRFIPDEGKIYKKVFLSGDFNNWQSSSAAFEMKLKNGVYEIKLGKHALKKGKNLYLFIADGQWIYDKKAKSFENRGIGGKVSIIYVD